MTMDVGFRAYTDGDLDRCLAIFDANCPVFFAPNERLRFFEFLESGPTGYQVCEHGGHVVGAFGLFDDGDDAQSLNWIMIDPEAQGIGIGAAIMRRVIETCHQSETPLVRIAASHRSAPFFEKFGAVRTSLTEHGWGPGMHRVDMELHV